MKNNETKNNRIFEENAEYRSLDQLPLVLSVLGVGINSAYQLVRSGQVGSIRIGRQYKIPKNALETYLAA